MMKRVIILGAGFSGLQCASRLSTCKGIEVVLLDKKEYFEFLPLLPDAIGRNIPLRYMIYDLQNFSKKLGIKFFNTEILGIKEKSKEVITSLRNFSYDYLVIATGSQTNFYNLQQLKNFAFKVDSCQDVERLILALQSQGYENYVVSGGGYTGVEIATNLWRFAKKKKRMGRVILLERAENILGNLPVWMRDYVCDNLKKLGIEIITATSIVNAESGFLHLTNGRDLRNAILIWTAGVRSADFIDSLSWPKTPTGRLKVDRYLQVQDEIFAIGDAACFDAGGSCLRMAVYTALTQGSLVAENIVLHNSGRNLKEYFPRDLGYIIPMANNLGCGVILKKNFKGRIPLWLHFLMCIFRQRGFHNKLGILKGLSADLFCTSLS